MKTTYDSKKPLENCEHKHLNRQVGVTVYEPFQHLGFGGAMYVDINSEWPTVRTMEAGGTIPADQATVEARIKERTEVVIERLDILIAELQEHRDRLAAGMGEIEWNV